MLKYMKAFQVHFGQTRVLSKNSSLSLLMSFLFGFSDLKNILLFLKLIYFGTSLFRQHIHFYLCLTGRLK